MLQSAPINVLEEALASYKNTKDKDIEQFLQKKAILYEKRGWCSTYCLINSSLLKKNIIRIDGYFTLSNKVIELTDSVTTGKRKSFSKD